MDKYNFVRGRYLDLLAKECKEERWVKMLRILKKNLREKKRGNQGITAAIILIAFVIIASLIAFVILSMGQQFAEQAEQTAEDAKSFGYVVTEGKVYGYDKFTITVNGTWTQQDYDAIVAVGTGITDTSGAILYYANLTAEGSYSREVQKSAFDTYVFQLKMPSTSTGTVDFTKVRVQLEIMSGGTHDVGGAFEFEHDLDFQFYLDDLGVDGTNNSKSNVLTTTSDDAFGWEDMTGDGDNIMEPGETYRVTLLVDMYAMGTRITAVAATSTEKHGFGYPHEVYENDQFEITIFVGETSMVLGPFTSPNTVEASNSW